jgi:hypothetical protein
MRLTGTRALLEIAVAERANGRSPERQPRAVRLRDAHDPATGQRSPQREGRVATDARTPVPAQYEELGDVEIGGVVAGRRSARREPRRASRVRG